MPETIEGKKIAVVAGTAHEQYLKTFFTEAELKRFPNMEAAREALRKGEVDLLFGDGVALAFWLNGTDSAGCCAFVGGPYTESRYFGEGVGIAVRRGNDTLRLAFNWALFRLWEKGRFTDLWLRYFPDQPVLTCLTSTRRAVLVSCAGACPFSENRYPLFRDMRYFPRRPENPMSTAEAAPSLRELAENSNAWPFEEAQQDRRAAEAQAEGRGDLRDRLRPLRPAAYRHVRRGRAHHHGAPCLPRAHRRQGEDAADRVLRRHGRAAQGAGQRAEQGACWRKISASR